jgi:hypothetical protein
MGAMLGTAPPQASEPGPPGIYTTVPDETALPPEEPFDGEDDGADAGEHDVLDRMRGTGVGVEDPNIVGDVGPTDIPPGKDPDGPSPLLADPPADPDQVD